MTRFVDHELTPRDYDYNETGRIAAARHCDRLRTFASKLDDCNGEEAIALACRVLLESQTEVARLAGIHRSRLSEMKRKKKPTRQDRAALIGAFVARFIL